MGEGGNQVQLGASEHSLRRERGYLVILTCIVALLASAYPWLARSSYEGSADLHAATEVVGALLGLIAGFALTTRFYVLGNRSHLFIGLAFFVNGVEDFVHGLLALASTQALVGPASFDLGRFIPGTYVTGRLLMGILLLGVPFADSLLAKSRSPQRETKLVVTTVLLATVLATTLTFRIPLPQFIYPDRLISRPVDFLSAVVLLLALCALLLEYHRRGGILTWWVALSISVNVVGQVLMSFSKHLYDPFFDIAHVYKVLGYAIPLIGLSLYQIAIISERLRAEEALQRHAVELDLANEEVRQFAYIVCHDLRAPLVNLEGFVAELRAALAVTGSVLIATLPDLNDKQRRMVRVALEEDIPEALGFIDSSVVRMDGLTSALLELSRLGRRELKLEPVDTPAIVEVALRNLAYQIEERDVRVTVGSLPQVVADRGAMGQIVGNILDNALKYLAPDRAGEIEITADRGPEETVFRVRDNGRGIAERDEDKVFAPFRRVGRQDVSGEGMGLPYVQALVRRHGGRLWYESELGVGTTFAFTVPDGA